MTAILRDLEFQAIARAAILAVLSTNNDSTDVTAHPVPNRTLPFIFVGESEHADHPGGVVLTFMVHCWSSTDGPHGAKQLQKYVHTALHEQNFEDSGVCYVRCRQEYSSCFLDPDDEVWHGVQRFSLLVSE